MQDKILNTPQKNETTKTEDPFKEIGLTKEDIANQVSDLQVRVKALE
jgi:hypothetical protein